MQPSITIALRAARALSDRLISLQRDWGRLAEQGTDMAKAILRAQEESFERAQFVLSKAYPNHAIHLEDGSPVAEVESVWRIGDFQAMHDLGRGGLESSFIIAQQIRGRLESGLICFPFLEQNFTVTRSRGAQLNDSRLRCMNVEHLRNAALGLDQSLLPSWLGLVEAHNIDIRVQVNPVRQHCLVAQGNLDGAMTSKLNPFAVEMLSLLMQEAGAITGSLNGQPAPQQRGGQFMSAHPRLFKQMSKANHELGM